MGAYAKRKKVSGSAPLPYPEAPEEVQQKLETALEAMTSGGAGGFLGNLAGDVLDIGKGIGTLAVHGVKDYVGETASLVSKLPVVPDYEHSSSIDDIVKAMPGAIVEDYKRRYGSGWDAFFKSLYEDPLSFAGDVLTVATLGGGVAAKGAVGASRIPSVSDDLARLAGGADDAGRVARTVDKILPGMAENVAAQRAGKPIGELPSIGGTRKVLDELNRVREVERQVNPVRRGIEEGFTDRFLSKPVGKLEQEIQRHIDSGTVEDQATAGLKRAVLDAARENDISRVLRPTASKLKLQSVYAKLQGEHSTSHIAERDRRIAVYEEGLSRVPKEEIDDFHLRLQGIEPTYGDRLGFDEIEGALAQAPDSPQVQALRENATPFIERIRRMEVEGVDPVEIEAGKRIVEWVAGEPLAGEIDEVASAMDDIGIANFAQETTKLVEAGMPMQTIFERALKPMNAWLKRQSGEKGWDFESPEEAFGLDDMLKASHQKAPVYFPHIDPVAYSRSDFLLPWRLVGMRRAAALKGTKRSEGVLFNRMLDDLEKGKRSTTAYSTSARDAFAMRAAQRVKAEEVESFIDDMTRSLGRPITAKDQVAKGEALVNLSGARTAIRTKTDFLDEVADEMEAGATREEAFIKAMQTAYADIDDKVAEAAAAKGNLWAVPQTVANKMQAVARSRIGGSTARVLVDAPNNFWRKAVLYWSPRFYVNNVLGNTTFLKLQGGHLSDTVRTLQKRFDKAYDRLPEDVKAAVEGSAFHSKTSQRGTHLGAAQGTLGGRAIERVSEAPISRALGKATEQGQRFNNFVEGTYRKASFIKGVEKELSKRGVKKAGNSFFRSQKRLEQVFEAGADPRIYRSAIDDLNKALNNYAALGPWERNIVRRFLLPFWPFYKHAAKTLIRMTYDHPLKARVLDLVGQTDSEMREEEMKNLPEWLQGSVPLGSDYVLTQGGMNPFAGIGQNPLAMLAPSAQLVLETATGRDSFTGKRFTSPEVVQPFGTDQQYRYDPETGEPVPTTVRPLLDAPEESLLSLFPQYDLIRDLLPGAGERYSTGETIEDQTGAPLYPTDPLSDLLRFAGVPIANYDLESLADRQQQERDRALTELIKRGLAP